MGNRACLVGTTFQDSQSGRETFGYRMYDDIVECYWNNWDAVPVGDLDLLRRLMEDVKAGEATVAAIDLIYFIRENRDGMEINDDWYEWDQIKDIIGPGESDVG